MSEITFKQARTKRAEMELPILHFVVVDQWIDVIGEKAFCAWLKLYSWCKRDKEQYTKERWEELQVSVTFSKIIKDLGVSRDTFYNKILKPLWNVGLIDIQEYKDAKNLGTKPINIIVYRYPQNRKGLAFEQIKMVRDYDTEYEFSKMNYSQKQKTEVTKSSSANSVMSMENRLKDVFLMNIEHFSSDGTSKTILLDLWNEEKESENPVTEVQFIDLVENALSRSKEPIGTRGSAKNYFKTVIRRYKENSPGTINN